MKTTQSSGCEAMAEAIRETLADQRLIMDLEILQASLTVEPVEIWESKAKAIRAGRERS